MILRVMLAVAYATGRASHARQVKGDDPDKKGYLEVGLYGLKENNRVKSHFQKQDHLIHHSVSDGNCKSQTPHNP